MSAHDSLFSLDAYKPAEIIKRVEAAGVGKSQLTREQQFVLGALAGCFIALGAVFYVSVIPDIDSMRGVDRLIGGLAFSLGLILVIVAGAELFTGDVLMTIAYVEKKISLRALLSTWAVVLLGNIVGALVIVALVAAGGLLDGAPGQAAMKIAHRKISLSTAEAFSRAVLCNMLVCLAVWLSFAARDVTGKILAIIWPITAFVAIGLEHSIANVYFLPAGLLAGGDTPVAANMYQLIVVIAGNIIGGSVGVGLIYRFVYLRG